MTCSVTQSAVRCDATVLINLLTLSHSPARSFSIIVCVPRFRHFPQSPLKPWPCLLLYSFLPFLSAATHTLIHECVFYGPVCNLSRMECSCILSSIDSPPNCFVSLLVLHSAMLQQQWEKVPEVYFKVRHCSNTNLCNLQPTFLLEREVAKLK